MLEQLERVLAAHTARYPGGKVYSGDRWEDPQEIGESEPRPIVTVPDEDAQMWTDWFELLAEAGHLATKVHETMTDYIWVAPTPTGKPYSRMLGYTFRNRTGRGVALFPHNLVPFLNSLEGPHNAKAV